MNSKKKNKNRQNKPPNPIPPQKEDVRKPMSLTDVTNAEIESVIEERVPNIVSESVTAEIKEPEQTPKKPKRNRGKKKKDDDKSDKEEEVRSDEKFVEAEIEPNQDSLEETNIAPTARKKKNKNRKSQGVQAEKVEEIKTVEDALIDDGIAQTQEQPIMSKEDSEQEIKSTKKKNKKKKNRNDSERSDKVEEVTCTSAFQKLLSEDVKVETIAQSPTDDSSISEATIKEVETASMAHIPLEENLIEKAQTDEGNRNKKKNKKDKKPQTVFDLTKAQEQTKSHETKPPVKNYDISSNTSETTREAVAKETSELHEVEKIMPSCSSSNQNTIKNKAKISKPVDKKKKGKGNGNVDKTDPEAKFESVDELKVTQVEPNEEKTSDILSSEDSDDVILVPITESTPDWHEEVITEEGNGPVIGCEDKHESIVLELQCKNHGNNKNRKSSPKPSRNTEKIETSNVTDVVSESESTTISKDTTYQIPAVKLDLKVEVNPEEKEGKQDNKIINTDVMDGNKKRDKRKKSPKPSTHAVNPPGVELSTTTSCETLKPDKVMADSPEHVKIILKEKQDDNLEINPEAKLQLVTSFGEETLPSPLESENIPEIQTQVQVQKKGTKGDEIERVHTPDNVKRQKRKKSPKPSVDISIASGSKGSNKSKQNISNIEDIIIIQAEVVSEEKAQKADSFIASEDSADQKDTNKMETKHESEKRKKRKKSPKPPQKYSVHEMKYNTENDCILETQGEVQMPITPRPRDSKLLPEALALDLETPKVDSMPSPSEVTPDFIEHPRCSSEQLDSNNNMVIQEIQHLDANFSVPVIIPERPFIQSTNISSPELVPSGIKVTAMESDNKPIGEKTDLKSKVLEVNQDMEELRMSIEKSLAELTSLEKSETDSEKNLETQNKEKYKRNQNIEVKQEIFLPDSKPTYIERVDMLVETKKDCKHTETEVTTCQEPVCPARKDHKGKGKSKKKSKQEPTMQSAPVQSSTNTPSTEKSSQSQNKNQDGNKSEGTSGNTQEKEKQKTSGSKENKDDDTRVHENVGKNNKLEFETIDNFEDAMTSSVDDVNKSFEIIANDADSRLAETQNNPEINITAPQEDEKNSRHEKQNPVSQPKNLLGHPDIPVPSNRTDYKKEKNKPPNCRQAKVKIKDANQVEIEIPEKSKETPIESKRQLLNLNKPDESICVTNQNEDYIYKYSFRKVFLQCTCHVCKKDLKTTRVPCSYCNLVFYCNQKHKDEDYSQHQALCFAVSTIVHLKDQKFIYADSRNVTGHNYRLLRMQMIVSCEKVLKRRLAPWEQEALLYPRMCALPSCREWRQGKLVDCEGCGQISYCLEHPDHFPKSHSRWCKSYNLYRGLVKHQQTKGRLEPKLPTRVLELSPLPQNINEVLAAMYEEKIEMSDIEYAALTQLATAPLTTLYCLQHRPNVANGITKKTMTLHIVGAELQFEADVLNKWEVFLLHLLPNVEELRVVLVGPDLNPSNLPLDLLGKIRYCDNCQRTNRRVVFGFQDNRTYHEFWASDDFTTPDLVCAFNPSIQRSSAYNGKDTWPATINCILKLKCPLAITSYTLSELTSDLLRVQECATVPYNVLCPPRNNSFASVRPDRNFISDDEAPLLFKNYCVTVVCGV